MPESSSLFQRRVAVMAAGVLAVFAILLIRVTRLQTVDARELADDLSRHRRHYSVLVPERGRLLDAHGVELAVDRDAFDLWVTAAQRERRGRRWETVGLLAPLHVDQLLHLGRLVRDGDAVRETELAVAADALARENAMIRRLADALPPPWGHRDPESPDIAPSTVDAVREARVRLARRLLAAVLRREPGTVEGLRETVRFVDDAPEGLFNEIIQRQTEGGDPDFQALRPRLGKVRVYPQGNVAAQLLGYVSELEPDEYVRLRGRWVEGAVEPEPGAGEIRRGGRVVFSVLPGPEDPVDQPTDEQFLLRLETRRVGGRVERIADYLPEARVGRAGLEQHYNEWLRGRHVVQYWWYERPSPDAPRERVPLGLLKRPRPGRDVRLGLDLRLQRRVEEILGDAVRALARDPDNVGLPIAASAVVMAPFTGRLHALASYPGYDPNRLRRRFAEWAVDPARPMRHHAVGEHFQPGSVIKPFVGLAALERNLIATDGTYDCRGVIRIGGFRVRCLKRAGHGPIDVHDALMHSCNTMFCHLAGLLRGRELYKALDTFGFGRRTGIDMASEAPGMLPWEAYTGRNFSIGELYHLGIGQNRITATPLQVASAYAALANATEGTGAVLVRPHLAVPYGGEPGPAPELEEPRGYFAVDPDALRVVRDGLIAVVQGDGTSRGTGSAASFATRYGDNAMVVAGKTGSAEISMERPGAFSTKPSHAWFAAYAPADARPEVVVVVMVEFGDRGGTTAGPLVKSILRAYFEDKSPRWRDGDVPALGFGGSGDIPLPPEPIPGVPLAIHSGSGASPF